jgi:hypothetical protein
MLPILNVEAIRKINYPNEVSFDDFVKNIPQISALMNACRPQYKNYVRLHSDNKRKRKMRMAPGGHLYRIPDSAIWNTILRENLKKAQALGYRGNFKRWKRMVEDE